MFATLWYAGAVVFVVGFEGMTLEQCNGIMKVIGQDIYNAYQDPETMSVLQDDGFYYENWKATCEPQRLDLQGNK